MKVFISSMIGGFEQFRQAARAAVTTLRHEPVMAEDFGALPHSPQIACLQGLRSADVVVLILGARYGSAQGTSGVSPTHEEYLDARGAKPILMFVQEGVDREPQQEKFLAEVQAWQGGHFRDGFRTAEELRERVTRAIHDYQLAHAAGPLDTAALVESAVRLIPDARRNQAGSPALMLAVAGGPSQRILRPAEVEAPGLADALHQRALFGAPRLFNRSKGLETGIDGSALFLEQEGGARIQLDESGSLLLRLPLERPEARGGARFSGLFAIIEETVVAELAAGIAFAHWALAHIDPTQRLTHVAVAARIDAADHMGWRTQAEQDASPNSGSMRMGGQDQRPVHVDRPRAALQFDAQRLAEDLMVPLRRQWRA